MGDSILPVFNIVKYPPPSATDATNIAVLAVTTMSTSTSTSSSATSTSTLTSNQVAGYGNSSAFYRNLFYILIALLVTFGIISILSWFRTRRRRILIFQEALRLDLLVPGMPGYAAERERVLLLMGGITPGGGMGGKKEGEGVGPGLWDVRDGEREKELLRVAEEEAGVEEEEMQEREGQDGRYDLVKMALNPSLGNPNLYPLSIKAVLHQPPQDLKPMPISTLAFFPQEHALRRPPPSVNTTEIIGTWEEEGPDGMGIIRRHEQDREAQDPMIARTNTTFGRPRTMSMSTTYPPPPGSPIGPSRQQDDLQSPTSAGNRKHESPSSTSPEALAQKRAIEVSFLIRMPVPVAPKLGSRKPRQGIVPGSGEVYVENEEDNVDNAIMDEWQGAEFGVLEVPILVDTKPEFATEPTATAAPSQQPMSMTNAPQEPIPRALLPAYAMREPGDRRVVRRLSTAPRQDPGFVTPSSPFGLIR